MAEQPTDSQGKFAAQLEHFAAKCRAGELVFFGAAYIVATPMGPQGGVLMAEAPVDQAITAYGLLGLLTHQYGTLIVSGPSIVTLNKQATAVRKEGRKYDA